MIYFGFTYLCFRYSNYVLLNISYIVMGCINYFYYLNTMFNMIGGLILVMSRLQAVVLCGWILVV
ncbi:hypothetical protein Hdeb2414_s1189g00990661 [Helianthus debilis subsp. tardiflorus]